MSVTEQRSADAMEAVTSIIDWARALDADRATAHARVKALEAENAALREKQAANAAAWGVAAPSGWVDRDRYSFRDDGKVLRVAEWGDGGDGWGTHLFTGDINAIWDTEEGATLAEAKANLDAWGAAPAKAKRYTARKGASSAYWFVHTDGRDSDAIRCFSEEQARLVLAALNREEP